MSSSMAAQSQSAAVRLQRLMMNTSADSGGSMKKSGDGIGDEGRQPDCVGTVPVFMEVLHLQPESPLITRGCLWKREREIESRTPSGGDELFEAAVIERCGADRLD
jgi:hypothetical protein